MDAYEDLPVLGSLDEVAGQLGSGDHVYVRWSHGPAADLATPSSSDQLTGTPLPGLSANPLDVEIMKQPGAWGPIQRAPDP